jgi:hypothetical protein
LTPFFVVETAKRSFPDKRLNHFWYPEHIAGQCKPQQLALSLGGAGAGKQSEELKKGEVP